MTQQKEGSPISPPAAWVSLLLDNHRDVHRVRMMWRRGKVPYRPLVPEDLNVDELTEGEWLEYERPETHFEWKLEPTDSPAARRHAIEAVISRLWDIARRWTRARGTDWCDFQLIGFDQEGDELFAVGRRLKVEDEPDLIVGEQVIPDAGSAQRTAQTQRQAQPAAHATVSEWREIHQNHAAGLKEVIDYTKTDRDDAVVRSRQTLDDNHRLWRQVHEASQLANDVLRETVAFEREQAERARSQGSGRLKLQAHALSEMERSQRMGKVLEFLKYGWDSAMSNLVPLARQVFEGGSERHAQDFPEFRWAQQAMAFLVIDLTPTQLDMMFEKNRDAAAAFLGRLDYGARIKVERDALEHVAPVVVILRSERFRDLTRPEQQLAARFIINKLAIYRMVEYGEDEPANTTNAG